MMSFAEYVLRYQDEWNTEAVCIADDLGISVVTLCSWVYGGFIPKDKYNDVLRDYFGDDFNKIKFDGKKFKRQFKVIRSDGSSQMYDTIESIHNAEGVSRDRIARYLKNGGAMIRGNYKGYRFENVYVEVN